MREVRRDKRKVIFGVSVPLADAVVVDVGDRAYRLETESSLVVTSNGDERTVRAAKRVEDEIWLTLGPASDRYVQDIPEAQRDRTAIAALVIATFAGHPHKVDTPATQVWSHHIALARGEDPVATRSRYATWDEPPTEEIRALIGRVRVTDGEHRDVTGNVFFDGTPEEIASYLRERLGTPAFCLADDVIELELPEVGKDRRPRPTGETVIVRFGRPETWSVEAPDRGSWWHVVPHGSDTALCTIEANQWKGERRIDDTHAITCPWCRARLIAIEIVDPPGPRRVPAMRPSEWSSTCVYTMRHTSELEGAFTGGGHGKWSEKKHWVRGLEIFEQAGQDGLAVPIVFSAADVDSGLIFHGRLTSVRLETDSNGKGVTQYSVTGIRRVEPNRPLSALRLVSTGNQLSDDYIRPYAICETPDFLSGPP